MEQEIYYSSSEELSNSLANLHFGEDDPQPTNLTMTAQQQGGLAPSHPLLEALDR